MADARLYVSPLFFKNISIEAQGLRLIVQSQRAFIDRAKARAMKYGDIDLFTDIDNIESYHAAFQGCSDRLEKMGDRLSGQAL